MKKEKLDELLPRITAIFNYFHQLAPDENRTLQFVIDSYSKMSVFKAEKILKDYEEIVEKCEYICLVYFTGRSVINFEVKQELFPLLVYLKRFGSMQRKDGSIMTLDNMNSDDIALIEKSIEEKKHIQ